MQEALHGMAAPTFRPVIRMAVPDDHDMLQWQPGDKFHNLTSPLVALLAPVHLSLSLQPEARNLLPHGRKIRRLANGCAKDLGARIPGPV